MILLLLGCGPFEELRERVQPAREQVQEQVQELAEERRASSVDCEDESLAAEPLRGACVTGTLSCGQSLQGHTGGGAEGWADDFYRQKFCTPLPEDYSGPERVYRIALDADQRAEVILDSPCGELDLFAVRWKDTDRCPTLQHTVNECEADIERGGGSVTLVTDRNPAAWLIAVDGRHGETAPFSLRARCWQR